MLTVFRQKRLIFVIKKVSLILIFKMGWAELEWYWRLLIIILAFVVCYAIIYYGLKRIIRTPAHGED